MPDDKKPRDARSLVNAILGDSKPAAPVAPAPETPPPPQSASDLIDLYFEVEDATERQVIFQRLIASSDPLVPQFLVAMMEYDDDDYQRAAATAELARRGMKEALAKLELELADPQEPVLFANAIDTLARLRGAAFYERCKGLWENTQLDAELRAYALLGLEAIDAERTLRDLVGWVDTLQDAASLPEDDLDLAIAAFVRHAHAPALPALERLRARVLQAPLEPDDKAELCGLVDEGMAQLKL